MYFGLVIDLKNTKVTIFFREFLSLLETVSITPGYLLLTGDYNFHMELLDNTRASLFRDLLESVGLTPYINGPTHRSGHTLDLFIDRQNDQMLSDFKIVSSMPSDHYAVICSIAFPKPKPTGKAVKQRQLRKINMKAFNSDILNSSLHSETRGTSTDVNSLTDNYNQVLRELLDKHAPECIRTITLGPSAP